MFAIERAVSLPDGDEPEPAVRPLSQIGSMDEYLQSFGRILGKKAVTSLRPLHVPNRGPVARHGGSVPRAVRLPKARDRGWRTAS